MAHLLYRLGRLVARRAWAVVLAWILVLAALGGAAGMLAKPFNGKLAIPGTEFQEVIDDLGRSLPAAAGGSGTVVLRSEDGRPFTQAQKQAVSEVVGRWAEVDGVESALDPFATQAQLDDARAKVAAGAVSLRAGEAEIAANARKLADGKVQLAQGDQQLTASARELAEGRGRLEAGRQELAANAARLAEGRAQLDAGAAQLAQGRKELDANAAKVAASARQIADGERQIAAARQQLTAARAQIATAQQQLDAAPAQIAAGREQIAAAQDQLAAQATQLDAQETELAALEAQVGPDDPRVVAGRDQLAAARTQVDAATQELAARSAELAATEAALPQQRAEVAAQARTVEAGQAQLATQEKTLAAGRAQLADGQKQLQAAQAQWSQGQAAWEANQARVVDGERALAAGRAQLQASERQIADGESQLAAGRQRLEASRAELAAGETALEKGRAEFAAGTADLRRGERQVAVTDGLRAVSEDGTVAVSHLQFTQPGNDVTDETKQAIPAAAGALDAAGVRVDYSADISTTLDFAGPGEVIGVFIAGIVLVVMLGSLIAAGLPLLTALVGVGAGMLGTLTITHWVELTDIAPVLALMLGLAVGIDYALFLVNRHREQLAGGMELQESIGRATGTAGSAVLFAGLTVVVALAALVLTGIPFLGTMGLAAAATVATAVVVSLTLTPALLRLIGPRVLSPRARATLAAKLTADEGAASAEDAEQASATAHRGHGWGDLVTRRPLVTMALATALLVLLAIPAASLRLGLPDGSYEPTDSTAHRAYTAIAESFGAGQNGPIVAVAQVDPQRAAELDGDALTDLQLDVAERLRAVDGVSYVVPVTASADRERLVLQVVPTSGPSEDATTRLVHDLRDRREETIDGTGVTALGFAGQTVANIDISERLASALPLYLAVVVGISLVLLLLVFRSVVVPLLATAGFLLSVLASFGAVVAVYQWGWMGSIFGVEQAGPVLSFLPTLVIGILFGLAMDYQMFLVSGMRHAWSHGHTARTAVHTGFRLGARVVTAAALIMTSVFASFVHSPMTMVRPIGFALAIGVLIDAFVVRMTAMPAIMHLLGERAWYLPRWLDRILPDLDVEGTKLP